MVFQKNCPLVHNGYDVPCVSGCELLKISTSFARFHKVESSLALKFIYIQLFKMSTCYFKMRFSECWLNRHQKIYKSKGI
ncbi:hypothetical protein DPQ33_00580 [Oceanidesulfovibrio indonesiensis]|uniref:Uncharacterized protein n=1 Tax=Oceanidesulfovibrio indonesiensis TaxID=54767 RepID=A0A7M3MIX2_9BACT|nr:hypothetical protein DPQ33_00580 [Oceanidesulfovibrio indonesiensis]